jgi:hypothetical protein
VCSLSCLAVIAALQGQAGVLRFFHGDVAAASPFDNACASRALLPSRMTISECMCDSKGFFARSKSRFSPEGHYTR